MSGEISGEIYNQRDNALTMESYSKKINVAKPFLKWAGGKTQLLKIIEPYIPFEKSDAIVYIEPFVGSGAFLFWMLEKYPSLERAVINDINVDLINTYSVIKTNVDDLIILLEKWETEYYAISDNQQLKSDYYYTKRDCFNARESAVVIQAGLLIFLNRTCFNGLYRVNRSNHFNVPIGSYKRPTICDKRNLIAVSRALSKVKILHGDFEQTNNYVSPGNTICYMDPPYKPLNATSNFNSYSKDNFDDVEQVRLKRFCDQLKEQECFWLLSNSDVRTEGENDFFDSLYHNYEINRVKANRRINANANKRGDISELLIANTLPVDNTKRESYG